MRISKIELLQVRFFASLERGKKTFRYIVKIFSKIITQQQLNFISWLKNLCDFNFNCGGQKQIFWMIFKKLIYFFVNYEFEDKKI